MQLVEAEKQLLYGYKKQYARYASYTSCGPRTNAHALPAVPSDDAEYINPPTNQQ